MLKLLFILLLTTAMVLAPYHFGLKEVKNETTRQYRAPCKPTTPDVPLNKAGP